MNTKRSIRRSKLFRKMTAMVIVVGLMVQLIGSTAMASTVTTTGYSEFNSAKAGFQSAKKPMYTNKTQVINDRIAKKYDQNIYHYECQEGGYYAFYTRGSTDTVGALYEENGIFTATYDYVTKNDDYFPGGGDSNFYFVVDLDKWEDYYVCVRGYGEKTGSYKLNIEPNEDKIFHKNYGVWKSEHITNSAANIGMWVQKKVYLNKEQTILYYWSLDPATKIVNGSTTYTISQLQQLYKSDSTTALNVVVTVLASAIGVANTGIGITASIIGLILTEGISANKSQSTARAIQEKLVNLCGVEHRADAQTFTGSWSARKGLLATLWFTGYPTAVMDPWEYEAYSIGSQLKGVKWYAGKWSF